MDHREFKRIVPEARSAVLFLHGIVSTPRHFDPLLTLVPEDVSVWALLLDGHGKEVPDFGRTSMKKWETQVQKAILEIQEQQVKLARKEILEIPALLVQPERKVILVLQVQPGILELKETPEQMVKVLTYTKTMPTDR